VPATANRCVGCRSVEVVPSSKFHSQAAIVPSLSLLVSVKATDSPVVRKVNSAAGG
jgi:hypothetical protein